MLHCHRGRKACATREASIALRTDVVRSFSVLPSACSPFTVSVGQRFDFSRYFPVPLVSCMRIHSLLGIFFCDDVLMRDPASATKIRIIQELSKTKISTLEVLDAFEYV